MAFNENPEQYRTTTPSHADEFNQRQDVLVGNDVELKERFLDIIKAGILTGGSIYENSTPDLTVLNEITTGYDSDANKIESQSENSIDLSSYLPTATGNEKWVSVYIDAIDLQTNVEYNIVEGTSATAGSATKPTIDNANGVLLADVLLAEGQTSILNGDIDESRKVKVKLTNNGELNDAKSIDFDDTNVSFTATESQSALEKLNNAENIVEEFFSSGVQRNLKDKLEENYVSVKDFGAKGDNTTDDTQAIKDAVSYIENNDETTLFFPQGNYLISSVITINKSFNIIGSGITSTTIMAKADSFLADTPMIKFDGTTSNRILNAKIGNFKIRSQDSKPIGLVANWVNKSIFENIDFYNLYRGYKLEACWSTIFNHLTTYNVTTNVTLGDSMNHNTFLHCNFGGTKGITIRGRSANLEFLNCDFEGNDNNSIIIEPVENITGIAFNNCYFENVANAVRANSVNGGNIYNLQLKNNYFNGKLANSEDCLQLRNIKGLVIKNNYVQDWNSHFMYRTTPYNTYGEVSYNMLENCPNLTSSSNTTSATVENKGNYNITLDTAY